MDNSKSKSSEYPNCSRCKSLGKLCSKHMVETSISNSNIVSTTNIPNKSNSITNMEYLGNRVF